MNIQDTSAKFNSVDGVHSTKWQKQKGGHVFASVVRYRRNTPRAGVSIGDMTVKEVQALAEFLTDTVVPMMEDIIGDRQYHARKIMAQIAADAA